MRPSSLVHQQCCVLWNRMRDLMTAVALKAIRCSAFAAAAVFSAAGHPQSAVAGVCAANLQGPCEGQLHTECDRAQHCNQLQLKSTKSAKLSTLG